MGWIKGIITIIVFLVSMPILTAGEYKKETQASLTKPTINNNELAAVNFILEGENPQAVIEAEESSDNITFSGKNHNLKGTVIPGGSPAIRLNSSQENLEVNNVSLEGIPTSVEADVEYNLNMATLDSLIRNNADMKITEDTTLQNTTFGSEVDYKILYVDNARLTLSNNFTGYGILYIEDENYPQEQAILQILSNAKWYGLIIVNQLTQDKTTKVLLQGGSATSGIGDYAILGIDNVIIGNNLRVKSGSIGVNSPGGSISLGNNAIISNSLLANIIILGNNGKVNGDVHYNNFIHGANFTLKGEAITPITLPLVQLPEFPSFKVGTKNINQGHNKTYYLNPGSYGNISFGNNCTLYLTGGEYKMNKLSMGNNAKIKYLAPVTIMVKRKVTLKSNAKIEPEGEGLDAKDCIFYVKGEGCCMSTKVFYVKNNARLYCNIYAPDVTVKAKNNLYLSGAIIAKKIIIGNNLSTDNELKSAFPGSSSQKVNISGSIIFKGNNFYIPDEGSNANVYYCKEALNKVTEKLNSLPFVWNKWKETE